MPQQKPCHASRITRRRLLALGAGSAALALHGAAHAQEAAAWPTRPIQLIVPWPAGGATDLTTRVLGEEAEPLLGQPVVVLNRPGAAGTLVVPALKAAAPDGHTIGQVPLPVYRHALMYRVAWDPVADLSPILQVSGVSFGLLVPASSPWQHLDEMLHWARRHPGELVMGSTGMGTTAHLAIEAILQQHGIRYVHVPYKGTVEQMLAIASGQIMAGVNSTGFAPWVDKGQLRLLGLFSAQRSARWPQVPTLRELGYPDAVYTSPWGLAAPAGTPPAIIARLHQGFRQAMRSPRYQAELARYDQHVDYLDTEAYRQSIETTLAREKQLLARMNLLASPSGEGASKDAERPAAPAPAWPASAASAASSAA